MREVRALANAGVAAPGRAPWHGARAVGRWRSYSAARSGRWRSVSAVHAAVRDLVTLGRQGAPGWRSPKASTRSVGGPCVTAGISTRPQRPSGQGDACLHAAGEPGAVAALGLTSQQARGGDPVALELSSRPVGGSSAGAGGV